MSIQSKPTVYIDLLGTLVHWADQEIEPIKATEIPNSTSFKKLAYTKSVLISQIYQESRPQYSDRDKNPNQSQKDKRLLVLPQYKEILQELRQTCQLRLLSWAPKPITLKLNEVLDLGFERREILSKDDMPNWDIDIPYSIPKNIAECPDAILISNHSPNSKASIQQRITLGIEKEQQVHLQSLAVKCLDLEEPTKFETTKVDLVNLSDIKQKHQNPSLEYF
jgi:hypothetical protein